MPRPAATLVAACALGSLLSASACSRGADAEARRRVLEREPAAPPAPAAPDLADPRPLLGLDAGEAARRLGSFDWSGAVTTTVTRQGDSTSRTQVTERHKVRQLASGEFEVAAEIEDGLGEGGDTGKHVLFTGGRTYARAQYAPWRERPTDRGRDARRARDESFLLVAEVARLHGAALELAGVGDGTHLGRKVRRYVVTLARAAPAAPRADDRAFGTAGPDEDTRRHLAFLDGHIPTAASGELWLDEQTGVLLKGRLSSTFGLEADPRVRVQVEVTGEVRALGEKVAAVAPPRNPLPDVRRPPGVAAALEQAGLSTREKKGDEEPADEPETPEK
jgi:hypothetical protein